MCDRIKSKIKTVAYSNRENNLFEHSHTGQKKFTDITLKRGITQDRLSKREGPPLNVKANEVAFETLKISQDGLELV
jgi:hypothetical protein